MSEQTKEPHKLDLSGEVKWTIDNYGECRVSVHASSRGEVSDLVQCEKSGIEMRVVGIEEAGDDCFWWGLVLADEAEHQARLERALAQSMKWHGSSFPWEVFPEGPLREQVKKVFQGAERESFNELKQREAREMELAVASSGGDQAFLERLVEVRMRTKVQRARQIRIDRARGAFAELTCAERGVLLAEFEKAYGNEREREHPMWERHGECSCGHKGILVGRTFDRCGACNRPVLAEKQQMVRAGVLPGAVEVPTLLA